MENLLLEAAKTNSPSVIICSLMVLGVYYLIKGQRDKTAAKRDEDKKSQDVRMALQEKDVDNLKSQVNQLNGRWDSIRDLLGKMNENISAILQNMINFEKRMDRLERNNDKDD